MTAPASREGLATITIEDTGIGIAEQKRSAVFAGFYRTKEGRQAAKGTGVFETLRAVAKVVLQELNKGQ